MGASCKFNSRMTECDNTQLQIFPHNQTQSEEASSLRNMDLTNATTPLKTRKNVFLIYSKNPDQQQELILQLQQLNQNDNYIIQQYEQLTSQQIESPIEEYFPLVGLSEGSFNAISNMTERD